MNRVHVPSAQPEDGPCRRAATGVLEVLTLPGVGC